MKKIIFLTNFDLCCDILKKKFLKSGPPNTLPEMDLSL